MRLVILAMVFLFSGCAATRSPDSEIIIRELGSDVKGNYMMMFRGGATLGGGRISILGEQVPGCVQYIGEKLSYASPGCLPDTMP